MPLYFPAFAALARAPLPRPICRPEHKPYKSHLSLPAAWSGLLTPIPLAPFQCLSACALALACGMAVAQTTTTDHLHHKAAAASATAHSPAHRWSEANDTVGQFQRGHIDLLRWEQRNNPLTNPADNTGTRAAPLSLEQALRMALQNQPRWLSREGMSPPERAQLNTAYQERVLQVRRAWFEAVTSHQSAQYSRQILQAAEAGAELAERMARIGNWSRARQMQEELLLWDARTRVQNADLQALRNALALWQLTGDPLPDADAGQGPQTPPAPGTSGPDPTAEKPEAPNLLQALPGWLRLPPLPHLPPPESSPLATLEARTLAAHLPWSAAQAQAQRMLTGQHARSLAQARLAMAQASPAQDAAQESSRSLGQPKLPQLSNRAPWSHSAEAALQAQADADAWQRQIRADVRVAHAALHNALTHAAQSRQEVLRLHTALQQENLLRYNGMLSSTWELLASARQRIQTVDAAHQAQHQAWLAWADLQAVLSGLPYTGRPGAATSPSTTPPAGH